MVVTDAAASPRRRALAGPSRSRCRSRSSTASRSRELPRDLYIPPQALEVFLEAFEGPLDLLLYLIRRQNLDILDIPIAEITRQYMQYIELMQELQLELAGEYLVMAATLAEIKSRMLLPRAGDPTTGGERIRAPSWCAGCRNTSASSAPPSDIDAAAAAGARRLARPAPSCASGRWCGRCRRSRCRRCCWRSATWRRARRCSRTITCSASRCRCASACADILAALERGELRGVRAAVPPGRRPHGRDRDLRRDPRAAARGPDRHRADRGLWRRCTCAARRAAECVHCTSWWAPTPPTRRAAACNADAGTGHEMSRYHQERHRSGAAGRRPCADAGRAGAAVRRGRRARRRDRAARGARRARARTTPGARSSCKETASGFRIQVRREFAAEVVAPVAGAAAALFARAARDAGADRLPPADHARRDRGGARRGGESRTSSRRCWSATGSASSAIATCPAGRSCSAPRANSSTTSACAALDELPPLARAALAQRHRPAAAAAGGRHEPAAAEPASAPDAAAARPSDAADDELSDDGGDTEDGDSPLSAAPGLGCRAAGSDD